MVAKTRPHPIQILLNAAERNAVRKEAARRALSTSAYARFLVLTALRRDVKLEQQLEQRMGIGEEAA